MNKSTPIMYRSTECEAALYNGWVEISANGETITQAIPMDRRRPLAVMFELTEFERAALGLPGCEANTGGTALCLARADALDSGEVPLPSAPRSRAELVDAELWPMQFASFA